MIVMLRHLGIPARLAAGFSQGTYDSDAGQFVVREREAHTWVEVYFPGYGWIEFEPTSAQAPIHRDGDELAQEQEAPQSPEPTATPSPSPSPTTPPSPTSLPSQEAREQILEQPTATPTPTALPSPSPTPFILPTVQPPISPDNPPPLSLLQPIRAGGDGLLDRSRHHRLDSVLVVGMARNGRSQSRVARLCSLGTIHTIDRHQHRQHIDHAGETPGVAAAHPGRARADSHNKRSLHAGTLQRQSRCCRKQSLRGKRGKSLVSHAGQYPASLAAPSYTVLAPPLITASLSPENGTAPKYPAASLQIGRPNSAAKRPARQVWR